MRLVLAIGIWCLTGTSVEGQQVPALPEGLHLRQPPFIHFDSRIRDIRLRCVLYEKMVGSELYFWQVCRLASDRRLVMITTWSQFGETPDEWKSEIFFPP